MARTASVTHLGTFNPVGALEIWEVASAPLPETNDERRWLALTMVGLITALGGLVGAPLALIRVFTTERQTKAQEEGLITDRINNAVRNLGADKQASNGHDQTAIWVPNIEVRIGAILELERLARTHLEVHVQIMEILCAYIRENSVNSTVIIERISDESGENDRTLNRARSDVFTAVKVLTARCDDQVSVESVGNKRFKIDLRFSDLSYCDMSHGDFSDAILIGCKMIETVCVKSDFTRAFMSDINAMLVGIETANFDGAFLKGDNLNRLNLMLNLATDELEQYDRDNPPPF